MKRLFSFLLALAVLLAMSIPVFADEPAPGSVNQPGKIISEDTEKENGGITISNATAGLEYTVYKIFDADIVPGKPADSQEGVTYTLAPDSAVCQLLFGTEDVRRNNDYFEYDWDDHRVTVSRTNNPDGASLASYLQGLVKTNPSAFPYMKKTAAATTVDGQTKTEVTLTFEGLQYGYYLIDRGTTGVATLNSTAPTMTVVDKNQVPGDVDKFVKKLGEEVDSEGKDPYNTTSNNVNISDVVTYKIEFTATNYAGQQKIKYYEIHDVKGTGIWAEFNSFRVKIDGVAMPGYYVNDGGNKTDDWSHLNSWTSGTPDIQQARWYLVHKGYDNYSILIPWIDNYEVRDDGDNTQSVIVADDGTSLYDSPVEVEITYNATIEPNAAIGPNTNANNNNPNLFNTAQLQWFSKYTSGYTNPDTVYSETYGLTILKREQGEGDTPVLAGAKFKVYKDEAHTQPLNVIPTGVDGVYILDSEGTEGEKISGERMDTAREYFEHLRKPNGDHIGGTDEANWVLNEELAKLYQRDAQGNLVRDDNNNPIAISNNEVVTAANGRLVILGLDLGIYYFEETEAPDAYNKLEKPFSIEITKDSNSKVSIYAKDDGSVVTDKNQAVHEYPYFLTDRTVENSKGAALPSTGGEGRVMLISIGSMIAMAFAVLLITQKKMSIYKD